MTPRRFTAADWGIMGGLMAAGLALRLWCWSGIGLADDGIFMPFLSMLLRSYAIPGGNLSYRFAWWLPTGIAARFLGEGELAMVLPCLAYAVLGIGLVYAFGHMLLGRWGGVVAASLLVVHPFDVTFSTMVSGDFALSCYSAIALFALLRALAHDDPFLRRRCWTIAAAGMFLAYHAKVSGLQLFPIAAVILVSRRDRLDGIQWFLGTLAVTFGASAAVSYVLTGSVFGPIRAEMYAQGLLQSPAGRQVTSMDLLLYPRVLFQRPHIYAFLNAFYPHALVLLALLAWPLRLRVPGALWWWFGVVVCGLVFNVQHIDGYWVCGFRNVRHSHVLVYPLCLLLAAYLTALHARMPRAATVLTVALLASSFVEARSASTVTQTSFADGRAACAFLAGVKPGVVYLDDALSVRCQLLARPKLTGWTIHTLRYTPEQRRLQLAEAETGYVVTGGGREPVYGSPPVMLASELPPGRVELVLERPGTTDDRWRAEPLRIWKLLPPAQTHDH